MKNTPLDSTIAQFPIRELSERTGVNSVTLRAWERRYGLLKPFRTAKGHRLYSEADVDLVKRVLYWIHQGVAVGKVRALLKEEQKAVGAVLPENYWLAWQQGFCEAVASYAVLKWEQMLLEAIKQYPISVVLKNGLLPVLQTLQSQANIEGALLLLRSSLIQVFTSICVQSQRSQSKEYQVLILSVDGQSLFSRMLAWVFQSANQTAMCVPEVRSVQQLTELVETLQVPRVVVVGDALSHQEAKRWFHDESCQYASLTWVGSGFWLASHESKQPAEACFSSSFTYLEHLLRDG